MVAPDKPEIVLATSGRSSCQVCKEKIAQGTHRVGMPARRSGISVTKWICPECFANPDTASIHVDYAPTGRAKCTVDGGEIAKGATRVLFQLTGCDGSVTTKKIYRPANARQLLEELAAVDGIALVYENISGMDELSDESRTEVLAALNGEAPVAAAAAEPASSTAADEPPADGEQTKPRKKKQKRAEDAAPKAKRSKKGDSPSESPYFSPKKAAAKALAAEADEEVDEEEAELVD